VQRYATQQAIDFCILSIRREMFSLQAELPKAQTSSQPMSETVVAPIAEVSYPLSRLFFIAPIARIKRAALKSLGSNHMNGKIIHGFRT